MKRNIFQAIAAISLMAAMSTSCGDSNTWKINGEISDAASKLVTLQSSDNAGRWLTIDTITADKNGRFKFKETAPLSAEIYRLKVDGVADPIYFPVDSIETITLSMSEGKLSIDGNPSAEIITQAENLIAGSNKQQPDSALKRTIADLILANPTATSAYYLVNRRVGNTPIFDPANARDLRIIGAVANAYINDRPNDPRTPFLRKLYLSNRRSNTPTVVEATEISLPELALLDPNGKRVDITAVAGKNGPVMLIFTSLTADGAAQFDMELRKIYDAYSAQGLQIYAVGVDSNEYEWRTAAANLPWINVLLPANDQSPLLRYNVGTIPTIFIIDRNGNLAERITEPQNLSKTIEKYL